MDSQLWAGDDGADMLILNFGNIRNTHESSNVVYLHANVYPSKRKAPQNNFYMSVLVCSGL